MNALSELSNLPERKEQIKEFARQGIDQILNGEYSALEFDVRAKAIIDTLTLIREDSSVKQLILSERDKYVGQIFFGSRIERGAKKTWHFDNCNDHEWKRLKTDLSNREMFLKSLINPVADPETGEIIKPATFTKSEFVKYK